MIFSDRILELSNALVQRATDEGLRLTSAESCTGGLIAAAITETPGASAVFDCGYVVYANSAKTSQLGVPADLIETFGAVSEEVACAMAEGAYLRAGADIAVAVTGIAGPGGGSAEKPVGLVHLAAAGRNRDTLPYSEVFTGTRVDIRERAVETALALLLQQAETAPR